MTFGHTQTSARELLRPAGFTLVETIKHPSAVALAARRLAHLPVAEEDLRTIMRESGCWYQLWHCGARWRGALIDSRTLIIVRVHDLSHPVQRIWPPFDATTRDLKMGANL